MHLSLGCGQLPNKYNNTDPPPPLSPSLTTKVLVRVISSTTSNRVVPRPTTPSKLQSSFEQKACRPHLPIFSHLLVQFTQVKCWSLMCVHSGKSRQQLEHWRVPVVVISRFTRKSVGLRFSPGDITPPHLRGGRRTTGSHGDVAR